MRFANSSLAVAAVLMLGFGAANATAQTYEVPTNQPPSANQPRTDQPPGARSDITRVKEDPDISGVVSGQTKDVAPGGKKRIERALPQE